MRKCCAEEKHNRIVSKEEKYVQTCEPRRNRSESARNPLRIRGRTVPLAHLLVPWAHLLVPLAHLLVPLAHLLVPLAHLFCPAVLCEHHLTISHGPLAHLSDQVRD